MKTKKRKSLIASSVCSELCDIMHKCRGHCPSSVIDHLGERHQHKPRHGDHHLECNYPAHLTAHRSSSGMCTSPSSSSLSHLPKCTPPLYSSRNLFTNMSGSNRQSVRSDDGVHCHRTGHKHRTLWQSILMVTLLSAQMVTVHAMLDALKALFILTGASTYLVTKYVNITNRTDAFMSPDGYFHATGNGTSLNLSRFTELNPALNFFKGDLTSSAVKPMSGLNSIRPMYVLAIEEEEEERSLPKLLLKLSISDRISQEQQQQQHQHHSPVHLNISDGIEYILDAKMDDLGPVLDNFLVNKSTGELFLIKPLDRDPPKGRAMWKFSVQARNRQTQFILAVADVLITVRDINDNKPLFEQKVYHTSLMENGPAGQILTKVNAIDFDDADTADNGKVVYSLVKSSSTSLGGASVYGSKSTQAISISDYFQLDPHTGMLTALACCFDREKRSEYKLVARATDAGGLSDEAAIIVTIGDLNDCPPKFINPSRTLVLNDDSFNSLWLEQNNDDDSSQLGNQQQNNQRGLSNKQSKAIDENIATFYISDDDLPETNHLSYEIANSTNCSLFHRFYMVANDDGSGSLFGSRAMLSSPLEYNRTYSCQLTIAVHDSVRDSATSSGQIYEDLASLTLIYRNNTAPVRKRIEQTSNAAVVAMDNSDRDTRPKPRIENVKESKLDHDNGQSVADQSMPSSGPKAYDLTGKRVPHSECSLCQNGGQCIVTETGYRFRCYCQIGFEGALCERAIHKSDIDRMLATITTNELLFYGCLIIIVNLLVIVLGLMVWIVKRVRHSISNPEQTNASVESNTIDQNGCAAVQILQQPMMMTCPILEASEFKQELEMNHYVIA